MNAKDSHERHDCEVARLDHYTGFDFPDRGDAHACQGGKPLLSYPSTFPALAELAGEQGSLRGIRAVCPAPSAASHRQLTLLADKLIAVKIYHSVKMSRMRRTGPG
jgi:hypothetical protein